MCQGLSSPETSWKPSLSFPGGTYRSSAACPPSLPAASPEHYGHWTRDGSAAPRGSKPAQKNENMQVLIICNSNYTGFLVVVWFFFFPKMCHIKGKFKILRFPLLCIKSALLSPFSVSRGKVTGPSYPELGITSWLQHFCLDQNQCCLTLLSLPVCPHLSLLVSLLVVRC